jgi:hypothetical protein
LQADASTCQDHSVLPQPGPWFGFLGEHSNLHSVNDAWWAAVLWLWHVYGRTVDPVAFAEGRWPRWPQLAYFMLTEIGLAILGFALLRSDLPSWIGWMLIGSMVLLFVLTLIYRDVAPFWFYLVTLIAGITLLAR